jgi:hypothetical protein
MRVVSTFYTDPDYYKFEQRNQPHEQSLSMKRTTTSQVKLPEKDISRRAFIATIAGLTGVAAAGGGAIWYIFSRK